VFGSYETGSRRKGTDTTSRQDITRYFEQIERLADRKKDIVLEGTRVSGKLIQQLVTNGYDVRLIWIRSSASKILQRNRDNGNTQTASHFVAEVTKAEFAFWRYAEICRGMIFDSENNDETESWPAFNLDSEKIEKNSRSWYIAFMHYVAKTNVMNSSESFATCFINVVQYPNCVTVKQEQNGYKSMIWRDREVPKLINARWKK
jgi:uncharacterized protein (UPF0335 family)